MTACNFQFFEDALRGSERVNEMRQAIKKASGFCAAAIARADAPHFLWCDESVGHVRKPYEEPDLVWVLSAEQLKAESWWGKSSASTVQIARLCLSSRADFERELDLESDLYSRERDGADGYGMLRQKHMRTQCIFRTDAPDEVRLEYVETVLSAWPMLLEYLVTTDETLGDNAETLADIGKRIRTGVLPVSFP